jgi:hypothetical protein
MVDLSVVVMVAMLLCMAIAPIVAAFYITSEPTKKSKHAKRKVVKK